MTSIPLTQTPAWAGQPILPDTIGYEVADPGWVMCCGNQRSVDADAALYVATRALDLGKIARTTNPSSCEDCAAGIEIDSNNPTITITSRWDHTIENETLHKIGRTTGWTYGGVEDTCTDAEVTSPFTGLEYLILCSDRVDYSSAGGDSGSPVFSYNAGFAQLRGIHFAGWDEWLGEEDGFMSDLHQIEERLGELIIHDPGYPSASISGPASVQTWLQCTWTATVTAGVTPFTYEWTGLHTGDQETIEGTATTSGWLYLEVTDFLGRTTNTSKYITVSPSGPAPPECGWGF